MMNKSKTNRQIAWEKFITTIGDQKVSIEDIFRVGYHMGKVVGQEQVKEVLLTSKVQHTNN
jgi:hypothetical protein